MATLTAAQLTTLSTEWTNYTTALADYRDNAQDPSVDIVAVNNLITDAGTRAINFSVAAMTTTFVDSADAFAKMQNVLTQTNTYVAVLEAKQQSWNRFSAVATAVIGFVGTFGGPALTVLGAADAVAKAYTGNPNATANDAAPTS